MSQVAGTLSKEDMFAEKGLLSNNNFIEIEKYSLSFLAIFRNEGKNIV